MSGGRQPIADSKELFSYVDDAMKINKSAILLNTLRILWTNDQWM